MIHFFPMPESVIVAVSMISALCVMLQSLSLVFNLNRHRREWTQSLEVLLEASILMQILMLSLLIAQVSGDLRDSLILPSEHRVLRYVLFGIVSLLAMSVSMRRRSPLPLIAIVAGVITLPYTEFLSGRAFPYLYFACLLYYISHSLYIIVLRRRELKTSISELSIKEAVDALQTGVLFCEPDGRIILTNKTMQSLMRLLTGRVWRNGIDFYRHITERGRAQETQEGELEGRNVLRLKDRSVWMFYDTKIEIGRKSYHQITAANVTEKWEATARLREQNIALDHRRDELTKTIDNLQTIYQKEEALRAKSRIHDVLGQQIALLIRSLHEEECFDPSFFHTFVKERLMNFAAYEPREDAESDLRTLIEMMEGIGVAITVHGALPEERALAAAFMETITEAVTNAVRHGFSKEIDIRCLHKDGQWTLTIQNSGSLPEGSIQEGSGIAGIRRRLAALGAALQIETSPRFALIVTRPSGPSA